VKADRGWKRSFDDLIPLPRGGCLIPIAKSIIEVGGNLREIGDRSRIAHFSVA
jgi:hypothetical protein